MKIGICGIAGKMGKEILSTAFEKGIDVCLGIEAKGSEINVPIPVITSPDELEKIQVKPDVIIDFSVKGAIIPYIEFVCKKNFKTGFVIGTTGFSDQEIEKIKDFSEKIPIFLSYNMSRGINLLLKILPELKKNLPDFDIEIVEIHHRMKKDSPSGTALRLAEALSDKETKKIFGREGIVGPRKKEEIGIFAVRGGDVVGEHTVFFLGDGERIEIKHVANSRRVFAVGAIYAAEFIYQKIKEGKAGFYTSIFS